MKCSTPKTLFKAQAEELRTIVSYGDSIDIKEFNERAQIAMTTIEEVRLEPDLLFNLSFMYESIVVPGWRKETYKDQIEQIAEYGRDRHGQLEFRKRLGRQIRHHVMPLGNIALIPSKNTHYSLSGRSFAIEPTVAEDDEETKVYVAPTRHKPFIIYGVQPKITQK